MTAVEVHETRRKTTLTINDRKNIEVWLVWGKTHRGHWNLLLISTTEKLARDFVEGAPADYWGTRYEQIADPERRELDHLFGGSMYDLGLV